MRSTSRAVVSAVASPRASTDAGVGNATRASRPDASAARDAHCGAIPRSRRTAATTTGPAARIACADCTGGRDLAVLEAKQGLGVPVADLRSVGLADGCALDEGRRGCHVLER